MDAPCKVQGSIHAFHLKGPSMCPGFWVHITPDLRDGPFYIFCKVLNFKIQAASDLGVGSYFRIGYCHVVGMYGISLQGIFVFK